LFRQDPGTWGWSVWPTRYRDPNSPEVAHFAEAKRERVEFFE
jgi:4-alpha-glucanotransferase